MFESLTFRIVFFIDLTPVPQGGTGVRSREKAIL